MVAVPQSIGYAIEGGSGCAAFGLSQYTAMEALKPLAVWNQTAAKARKLASDHGLKAYLNLDEMLKDNRIQLVHVATAPAHHTEHSLATHRPGRPDHSLVDQVACEMRYGQQATVSFYHGFCPSHQFDHQDFRFIFERGEATLAGGIATELVLHAVLNKAQIEQLITCLPNAEIETMRRDQDGGGGSRGRSEPIDREIRLRWKHGRDKQTTHTDALRHLLDDLITAINNPDHAIRISPEDGLAALEAALEADRLARVVTP